jgi:autotransporter-associated beta strand protein
MFGPLVLTADATICADGLDCGCAGGGRKALNGFTVTKIGKNQWYWGGRTTTGNFVVNGGTFILYEDPELEGTADNFIRVESGNLMFNQCTSAMKPVPHTLDWGPTSGNLNVYNKVGKWAGPWNITNNLTLTTSAKAPNNGVLTMEGTVVATNKTVSIASSHPGLILKGTNHSDFATINISGTCELRDGATMEIHPFASGARGEVVIAQPTAKVAEGLPAKLTVSDATLTSAFAAEKGTDYYGDIVLCWNADNVGVLDIQSGAVITGTLFCAQSGLGVVKQSGGEYVARDTSGFNNSNTLGANDTAYGAYLMSGGRFVSSASLNAATANGAVSVVRQDGGEFSLASGYAGLVVRSGYFSLYQTGGVFTNGSATTFGYHSTSAAGGRREIGVTGSGTHQYHNGDIRVGGNSEVADMTVLFLADGATIDFRNFTYSRPTGMMLRRFYLGSDGGVLRPTQSGNVFADLPPDSFTLYAGGLVLDTSLAGGDVTFSAALTKPTGKVVTGVTLPADAEYLMETNFVGPAKVTIDGGSGTAATAVTEYDETTRTLSGATVVSPGFGYQAGDAVTATVEGQFRKTTYSCSVTLGDPDTTGGFVKRGANRLVMTGANDYAGVTRIEGGTLEFAAGAYPSGSDVVITAEAADAARLSNTPALIVSGFPNGRTVTLSGADTLSLDGLDRPIRLARFTGTLPTTVQLDVRDSSGNPYVLPTGNSFYLQGGQLFVGKNNGTMVIFR